MPADELPQDDQVILAGAYQADRLRCAASNLAGWIINYLNSKRLGLKLDELAVEVVDAAITLAGSVHWNRLEFGRGGWVSRARVGSVMAARLVDRLSEAKEVVERYPLVNDVTLERSRLLAGKFATAENARACLAVVNLLPDLFVGPDAAERKAAAREVCRRLHGVHDRPPSSSHERLADALERLVPSAELPDLVDLDQAAAAVHTSKRTLERHKTEGTLPEPVVEGGGGKPALYDWKIMRPWLMKTFGVVLPERFPANPR
jgi:hypothetical protein